MRFFCPVCQAPITTTGDSSHTTCPGCGIEVDLALIDTSAGRPQFCVVMDHTSEQVGPYRLDACLGSGGMGTVYRALDTRNQRVVAVKLLYPQLVSMEHLVARFQREADALRALDHPRIVKYIDKGQADGQHFLIMEYVEGENLDSYLRRHEPSVAESFSIAAQIAEALDAAHAKGIVHRDLKPANIILSKNGVRVLDFGIAHMTTDDRTLTQSDAILGTVNYMSPEQRTRGQAVDHRSDLYSLGVILYRMLTGQLPLGAFEPVSRLAAGLGRRHDRLLTRLLQTSPERRYPSVREVRDELGRLTRSGSGAWKAAVAAVLVIGLGATVITLLGKQDPAKDEPAEGAADTDKAVPHTTAPAPATPPPPAAVPDEPATTEKTADLATLGTRKTRPEKKDEKEVSLPRLGTRKAARPRTRRKKKKPRVNTLTVPADGIPLFKTPDPKSEPLLTLTRGDEIRILGRLKDKQGRTWLRILTPEKWKGFVPLDSLK